MTKLKKKWRRNNIRRWQKPLLPKRIQARTHNQKTNKLRVPNTNKKIKHSVGKSKTTRKH